MAVDKHVEHVVIVVQENHTTDNYFRGLAPYGANVASDWPLSPNPPAHDQPHDRHAYFEWLTGKSSGTHTQFDTRAVLPYYMYLALTGALLENHCSGYGTNSTPNHLLIIGGQSPTLKNPSRHGPPPVWDLPSLPGHAEDHGVSWAFYAAAGNYPVSFYSQLRGSPHVRGSDDFVPDVEGGTLPSLVFLYHDPPLDEHPPADVSQGMDAVWKAVDAVVEQGFWESTVFLLTWDDWGGWDDHVATPVVEYTRDNVQLAYGPRVPLILFGGHVKPGIDSRWCSHVSIPKTALQLLRLPPLGVPRVDDDRGLADLIDSAVANSPPIAFGKKPKIPPPPDPPLAARRLPRRPRKAPARVPRVILRNGTTLPPPDDAPLPHQRKPPT
jgi:phospholipase C